MAYINVYHIRLEAWLRLRLASISLDQHFSLYFCTSSSRGRRSPGIHPGFVLEAGPLQRESSPGLTPICQDPPLDGPHVTSPANSGEMTNNKSNRHS